MEQSRSDLLNGDLTLPFIYALESQSMSIQDKKNLMDAFLGQKERIDNEDVQRIYVHTGALDSSLEKMKYYAENGRKSLEEFVQNEAGECIQYLIDQYYKHFNPKKKLEIII
jgi:geranylgeranyl pyrophosphate synthase